MGGSYTRMCLVLGAEYREKFGYDHPYGLVGSPIDYTPQEAYESMKECLETGVPLPKLADVPEGSKI